MWTGTSKKPFVGTNQDKVVSPLTCRDCTLGFAASDQWVRLLKAPEIALNYWWPQWQSNTGCSIKVHVMVHVLVSENVKKNFSSYSFALPNKTYLAWCPAPNYDSTFCAKYMTFKVHESIFRTLIRYLFRMVQFKKDVIAWCVTHKSKCVI